LRKEADEVLAVFPFMRSGKTALPVALSLTDFEGVVSCSGVAVDVKDMLRELGLRRWDFGHLVKPEASSGLNRWATAESPFVDLSNGYKAYMEGLSARHPSIVRNHRQNCRRIERNVGELAVRIEFQSLDRLETLLDWKSAQYEASGRAHPFRQPWARKSMAHFMDVGDEHLRGMMIVLYAGERPLAMEYCLSTATVTHALVTAYDVDHAKFSPGSVLQILGLEALAEFGTQIHDFGKGNEEYKQKFKTGEVFVGEGAIETNLVRGLTRSAFHRARYKFLQSDISEPAKKAARRIAERFPQIRKILRMR
jgi:CelD/BcsL family acetyltransferase involved in cellulose biosynthesis